MEHFFSDGLESLDGVEEDSSDEDSDPGDKDLGDSLEEVIDNTKAHDMLEWADKFILDTQQKGGHQMENSVLKLWKVCIAIN